MPFFRLPDGTTVDFPEGMDLETARRLVVAQLAGKHGLKKDAATRGSDVLSSLTSGVANTLGIVPGIVGLFGGSYENAPLAGTVKSMREYARERETPETTYKKYLIDQAIANASKQGGISGEAIETLKQLALNPGITSLKLLELIPDIVTAVGTGGLGSLAGKAAVKAFSKEAGEEAIKRGARRGATAGAVGTSAAQEGTSTGQEVYEETLRLLEKKGITGPEAIARAESAARAATIKQGLTVAALGAVLPGAEKSLLGVGKGGIRRTALGEAAEEGGTGLSGQLIQNIAAGEIDPTIALSRGVGRAGTEGAVLGALAGAGTGALTRRPTAPEVTPEVPPEAPPEDPAKAVTDTAVDSAVQRGDATVDEVEEADALARIAKIKSAAEAANIVAAKETEAAEAGKSESEEELRAAEEKKKPAPAAAPVEAVTPATETPQAPTDVTDVTQAAQAQQAKEEGPEAPSTDAAATATGVTPTEVDENAPSGTVAEGLGVGVSVAGQPSGGTGAEGTGAPSTEGLGKTGDGVGEPAGGTAGEPAALTGKQPKKAKAVKEPSVEEELTEEDLADEAAPVPRAYEKLDLADLEAKAAEVKAAPLAKAGEKISTRANLRTFDVNIPFDQARLEEKLAEVRKLPEKTLTKPQRAIRWYGAYVEANGGAVKDIPLYLAHNKADPALAATGLPKQNLQPAITWLNSNLGGTAGNNINAAAVGIRERLKAVESQRTESDSGKEKRSGGKKPKEAAVADKNFESRMAAIVRSGGSRAAIAERILSSGAKPKIIEGRIENGSPAAFDPKRNAIIFDPANIKPEMNLEDLLMHEAVHAAVDHMIDNPDTLSGPQKTALAQLKSLHEDAKKDFGKEFNIDSLKEFAAEALSNPDFQAALKNKKTPIRPFNYFSEFVKNIARLLRVGTDGTALIDTINALDKLISAPTKSRRGKEVSYAPSGAPPSPATPSYVTIGNKRIEVQAGTPEAKKPGREKTEAQKAKEEAKKAAEAERIKNVVDVPKGWYQNFVRRFQNAQREVLLFEEELRKRNLLTPDLAINTEITLQSGASDARVQEEVQPLVDAYNGVLKKISEKSGKKLPDVLAQLDQYFVSLTEPERRLAKFFEKAKLTEEGERRRALLFRAIVSNDKELAKLKKNAVGADQKFVDLIPDTMTDAAARKLYKEIEKIVLSDPEGSIQDIESSAFQTAGFRDDTGRSIPMTTNIAEMIRKETEDYLKKNPELQKLYGEAQTYQRDLDTLTRKLNREAGYGSPQLEHLIAARKWKNYVPLRGAPGVDEKDTTYENYEDEDSVSGALIQSEEAAKGRKSAAENVILRAFAEATRAATRPSRSRVTQTILNNVEKGYLKGQVNAGRLKGSPSTFAERFFGEKKLERGNNLVYHYREDGLVDVITIEDEGMARAIRNVYQNSSRWVDWLNTFTSGMGQMHTRYNPTFWAKNFLADVLTNSFVFAAEEGKGTRYLWQVVSDLVDNKLAAKGMNFIRLYEAGKTEELNKLAAQDSWYKDAQEYVRIGGKISQVSGLSSPKQQEKTYNALGPGRIVRTKQQLDQIIVPITDGLELAARVSAFRTYKSIPEYKDNPRGAVAASKNLANFENIGEKGRLAGALFMFFRPSATGGVRAIDALMKGKHGKRTALMALGMGFFIHSLAQALSDDDDEGRNRIGTDDADRWVRYWRFYIPGFKDPIQIPWGFGIGMLASIGAQFSMLVKGQNTLSQFVSNIVSAAKEGFVPLPFSQINIAEYPAHWLADTIAPSVARPIIQYAMNLDSLNREIFNKAFNRYSPMYVSKENMPESINQFSRFIYDTYVDAVGSPPWFEQALSPAGISFFMNNYMSAVYKGFGAVDGAARAMFADGQATPDLIKSTMVLGAFKGTPSNYDYRQFKEVEKELDKYSSVIKTYEKRGDRENLREYLREYPERKRAIDYFNSVENGALKELRKRANEIQNKYKDEPAERKERLEENRDRQNALMRTTTARVRNILGED